MNIEMLFQAMSAKERKQMLRLLTASSDRFKLLPQVDETSWGFPLIEGEKEVRPYVIRNENGVDIICVSKDFHTTDEKLFTKIIVDGEEKEQELYTGTENWFVIGKQKVEKDFEEKFGTKMDLKGYMVSGTKDEQKSYYVYPDGKQPEYDAAGCSAFYWGRGMIDGMVLDSASVFFYRCDGTVGRGRRAAGNVSGDVGACSDERGALLAAFEQMCLTR
ncbi:MAG: hypothetical protein FWD33_04050 [Alphaproteobacteria bacterium]|nr:hypothetical protein [Alphaproteobacteria bacterium]